MCHLPTSGSRDRPLRPLLSPYPGVRREANHESNKKQAFTPSLDLEKNSSFFSYLASQQPLRRNAGSEAEQVGSFREKAPGSLPGAKRKRQVRGALRNDATTRKAPSLA